MAGKFTENSKWGGMRLGEKYNGVRAIRTGAMTDTHGVSPQTKTYRQIVAPIFHRLYHLHGLVVLQNVRYLRKFSYPPACQLYGPMGSFRWVS